MNEVGKSFKILAFSDQDHRAIPISPDEIPIFPYEKPTYGVGFASDAPPPTGHKDPQWTITKMA